MRKEGFRNIMWNSVELCLFFILTKNSFKKDSVLSLEQYFSLYIVKRHGPSGPCSAHVHTYTHPLTHTLLDTALVELEVGN